MTPTPPPGMRIMSADELTKPLPMDAVYWSVSDEMWDDSMRRGFMPDECVTYATATPPPTDWRKLVEELVNALSKVHCHIPRKAIDTEMIATHPVEQCWLTVIAARALANAKAALEVKP